ncbi:MAG: hypothetical protein EBR30_20800 [Cytophagia bacterium]|nr:hypothetical protein [Cytophagia bacterium]
MIRSTIGVTIIIVSFVLKATLNHNMDYWGTVKSCTVFLFIVGLVVTGIPIFDWIEKSKPRSLKADLKKWILYGIKSIVVLVVMVAIAVQLEKVGVLSNEKLVEYYLSRETEVTEGLIVGEREVPYTIKTTHYEIFYVIKYNVNGQTIEQGLKPSYGLNIGQTYEVTYSKQFPTMFKVGHRTQPDKKKITS